MQTKIIVVPATPAPAAVMVPVVVGHVKILLDITMEAHVVTEKNLQKNIGTTPTPTILA